MVLPADQAGMLPALVLGDTSTVPGQTTQEFRTSGLAHLTAVSGANVTIVCGAVLLTATLIGPRAAVGLAAVTLLGFVVVVQPSPSVLRAAVMGAITLLAVLSHRRRQALPALAATVVVLMVGAPELAVDVGFALSVSATGALVLIAPVWSRRLDRARLATTARGGGQRRGRRATGHGPAGGGHLRIGESGGGRREPGGGAGYPADHRHRQRRRRAVPVVARGCRAADPLHRSGGVVADERGALGRDRACGVGACAVGWRRCRDRCGRRARCRGGVASVVQSLSSGRDTIVR